MSTGFFTQESFDILAELRANNDKAWMEGNRARVDTLCREPFEKMLSAISFAMEVNDISLSGNKKTMFRLHRDVRFSKNKAPYNSHVSGLLSPSGTKNEGRGVLYLQINPDGGRIGCGHYMLDAKTLAPLRDKMVQHPDKFRRTLEAVQDGGFDLSMDNSLTNMPRGYKEQADHELADYIKLKSLAVTVDISKTDWIKGDIIERAVSLARACGPLLAFRR